MNAWVVGASGVWGRAVAIELIRRGFDITVLGRRDASDLASWARGRERSWAFQPYDLMDVDVREIDEPPDALFLCAAVTDGDRETLVAATISPRQPSSSGSRP